MQYKIIDGLKIRYAINDKHRSGRARSSFSARGRRAFYAFLPTWEMFSGLGPVVAVDLPGSVVRKPAGRHGA